MQTALKIDFLWDFWFDMAFPTFLLSCGMHRKSGGYKFMGRGLQNSKSYSNQFKLKVWNHVLNYSASRLIGPRIIESAACCNKNLLAYTQNTSINWIIQLLLSLLCWPKVILLSSGHCSSNGLSCNHWLMLLATLCDHI